MASAVASGVPPLVDYTVELSYCGLTAWTLAAQAAALQLLVLELTGASAPPPVVLQRSSDSRTHVAVKARSAGDRQAQVVCEGGSVQDVTAELAEKIGRHSTLRFSTDVDRPGLLSEVTDLLKLNGANILQADITTEGKGAVHVYKVQDAATGRRLSRETVAQLEADFAALRAAGSAVRQVLQSVPAAPAGGEQHKGEHEHLPERLAIEEHQDCVVALRLPRGAGNVWQAVADLGKLRASVREFARMAELPPVVVQEAAAGEKGAVEVLAGHKHRAHGWQVLCSGETADAVEAKLNSSVARFSTITFETDNDRPGLLAEVTELLKVHGANIIQAEVRTDASTRRATHVYKVQEAATGQSLSDATIAQLEADFGVLRDAPAEVRRVLAAGGR